MVLQLRQRTWSGGPQTVVCISEDGGETWRNSKHCNDDFYAHVTILRARGWHVEVTEKSDPWPNGEGYYWIRKAVATR